MNKAVFLDRDGTINEDYGYLDHHHQIKLIPKSAEAIKLLKDAGYKVIVISNQSGIARGFFTEDMLQSIDKKLQKEILKGGGFIDDLHYCPHHPDFGTHPYKTDCDCRKPGNAMIKKAAKRFDIDLQRSYMIGDRLSDIEAGKRSGTKSILVLTGKGKDSSKEKSPTKPDHIAEDLFAAAQWILKKNGNA